MFDILDARKMMTRYSITHKVRLHVTKHRSKHHTEVMHFTVFC